MPHLRNIVNIMNTKFWSIIAGFKESQTIGLVAVEWIDRNTNSKCEIFDQIIAVVVAH